MDETGLKDHEISQHRNKLPYKSTACEETFMKQENLNEHQKCHTSVEKFECEYCDDIFITRAGLAAHVEEIH